MDETERSAVGSTDATVRPLTVEHDLGAITHLMLPQGISAPAPQAARYLRDVAETARDLVRERLIEASTGGRPKDVLAAIEAIGAQLVGLYEEHFAHQRRIDATFERGLGAVECRKGCSFCCYLKVTATILEVIRIAAALDGEPSRDRSSILISTADKVTGLSDRDRLARKVPCPLLIDGACSIYEVRPVTCRALLSRSASLCERQFNASAAPDDALLVPSPLTPRLLAASLINGQIAALRDLGLASHPVELVSALAALQRDPKLFVRWLNREDVFARA